MTTDHDATRQRLTQATGHGPDAVAALLLLLHDLGVHDDRLGTPPGSGRESRVALSLVDRLGPLDRASGEDPEQAWQQVLVAAERAYDARVDSYRASVEGWHDQADVERRVGATSAELTQAWLALAAAADRPWATVACLLAMDRMARTPTGRSAVLPPPT